MLDTRFRAGFAGHQRVGRIADHRQHAFVAQLAERISVGRFAQERIGIELPVAGVHDRAERRRDGQRVGFRDRMRDRHELDVERSELQRAAQRHDLQLETILQARFVEFVFKKACREWRRVDGTFKFGPEIRHRADVIFMRMRQHNAADVLFQLREVADVRHDEIDAGIWPFLAEQHAAIDDDPFAVVGRAIAVGVEVHADFARAAEGEQNQLVLNGWRHHDPSFTRPGALRL